MGTRVKALTLAEYGLGYELLVDPMPESAVRSGRATGKYGCPSIAYVIEHPDGLVLWETGISSAIFQDWPEEWQELVDLSEVNTENLLESRLRSMVA